MQMNEAKFVALSAAANLSAEETNPGKIPVTVAISYLLGKTDKSAFIKKCAKNPLYVRLILLAENAPNAYDPDALCAAHKALFDPKGKAGELRTGELTLPGGSCADPKILRGSLKSVLTKLDGMQGAPHVPKTDFAATLCCYIRELIILSPFAYGNGVVRRAFIQNFCRSRGFLLNYAAASNKELTAAESAAFASDDPQPLFTLLVKCLGYIQEMETAATKKPAAKPQIGASRRSASLAKPSAPPAKKSTAEIAHELREIQKTLASLSARINDLLQSLKDE